LQKTGTLQMNQITLTQPNSTWQPRQRLENWLKECGFEANPFASKEADFEARDQSRLVEYFVRDVWFDQILGDYDQPRSAILHAGRGSGKSASRLMLDYECRYGELAGKVLVANYLNFDKALEAWRQTSPAQVHRAHTEVVVEIVSLALLDYLRENPDKIEDLGYGGQQLLATLLADYTTAFEPFNLENYLRRTNARAEILNAGTFSQAALDTGLPALLEKAHIKEERDWLLLIGRGLTAKGTAPRISLGLLENLAQLVYLAGLSALYILVDRVDELPETAANPKAGSQLLQPLITDLRLMELPGMAFKFFLPTQVAENLFESPEMRSDRILTYRIEWTGESLLSFLQKRLLGYSQDKISSLGAFSEIGFANEVDRMLSQMAAGSPRNLLRLGELFINIHCNNPDNGGVLRRVELEEAYRRFISEASREQQLAVSTASIITTALVPPRPSNIPRTEEEDAPKTGEKGLRLSTRRRLVWRDGQLLPQVPVGHEYRLLEYLYQRAGEPVSKDELLRAVYGDEAVVEIQDDRLAKLVQRLRDKIEPQGDDKPGNGRRRTNPLYIITVPTFGFKLENRVWD
jgi:DNA-binding winged helix-turn-helix (wHTH) protein